MLTAQQCMLDSTVTLLRMLAAAQASVVGGHTCMMPIGKMLVDCDAVQAKWLCED